MTSHCKYYPGRTSTLRLLVATLVCVAFLTQLACKRGPGGTGEYVYVAVPQAFLRDRVAAVYNKTATVKNGDRLEVLDRQKRFLKVRTSAKEEGWIEQRSVIDEDEFKAFAKLTAETAGLPSQGRGVAHSELNMHLTPARDSEALYRLAESEKVDILKRATAERPQKQGPPPKAVLKPGDKAAKTEAEPPKLYDDWWLVRNKEGRAGWVLARMIDLDIPLDIAQYAEGQRIQAAFVLTEVPDGDKKVPEYLVLMSEPKDGLPFDYNQARVFTWNTKKHRYETAYRERNIMGFFPVKVGQENFEKEGTLPTFTLRVQAESGQVVERKYKLNNPIVRRVVVPGEEPVKTASAKKAQGGSQSGGHKKRK